MSKTIGVIGLGSIGSHHVKNLEELGHKVISYDPDPSKGSTQLAAEEVIRGSDAVVIASPTETHGEYGIKVVSSGKPCFMEKPIAGPSFIPNAYLQRIEMVGYNLRFRSCVIAAKEWMSKIGYPIWANFTVAQYNDKYTDSVILNWSHEIDLALYLLGPGSVTACTASGSHGRDDLADILLQHENGCHTAIHLDYLTRPEVRQFIVVGTQATIIADIVHNQAWLRGADEIMWDHSDDVDSFDDNYKDEMQAFIDRIDGKKTIVCTGEEALEVLRICLEARKQAGL